MGNFPLPLPESELNNQALESFPMAKTNDIRLGQILVQRKWCALRDVNEALLKQRKLRGQNQNLPLGRILVEKGAIDDETLREALAELGVLHLHCALCRADYPVATYQRNSVHLCPRCKGTLVLSDRPKAEAAPSPEIERALEPEAASKAGEATAVLPSEKGEAQAKADGARERDVYLGRVLGGCHILEKVAEGGMGVVYKARQLNLGRTVAVKILSGELASDTTFVRRFIQEARSAAQLNHGNIVHINDVGEYQGVFYFVMEYVDGKNLKEILKLHQQLDVPRALEITAQVCQALRHAHSRGIIHRDIKPENIMITRDGVVKLADLGLAKKMAAENTAGITHAGSILGTPFYMAPEQAKDFSNVDRRSDIYSLGVTLYRMLTGAVPFDGRSPIEVMIKAIEGKKVPMHELREDISPEVEELVNRMMHKQPDMRFQEVDELLRELNQLLPAITEKEPA
jgi:predicted Ser/Thr protein kinase